MTAGSTGRLLLDHSDISTTIIYTHALNRSDVTVVSPLDRIDVPERQIDENPQEHREARESQGMPEDATSNKTDIIGREDGGCPTSRIVESENLTDRLRPMNDPRSALSAGVHPSVFDWILAKVGLCRTGRVLSG